MARWKVAKEDDPVSLPENAVQRKDPLQAQNGAPQSTPAEKPLPKGIPPELIPVYDWWTEKGKSTLMYLAIGAVAVLAAIWFRNSRRAKQETAGALLTSAQDVQTLETAAGANGTPELNLLLAGEYLRAGRYDDALDIYGKIPEGKPVGLADNTAFGIARCKEGKGDIAGAHQDYEEFLKKFPDSHLALEAKIAAARTCGDPKAAEAALKALQAEDIAVSNRVELALDAIRRPPSTEPAPVLPPPAVKPAPAPAKSAPAAAKPAPAKPAPAKPAATKPAPAKPAATKPAAPAKPAAAPAKPAAAKPAPTAKPATAAAKPAPAKPAATKPAAANPAPAKPATAKPAAAKPAAKPATKPAAKPAS